MTGHLQLGAVGLSPAAQPCSAPNRGGRCAAWCVLPAQATDMPVPCAAAYPDRGSALLSATSPASTKGWPAIAAGQPFVHVMLQIFSALRSRLLCWRNAQPGQMGPNPPLLAH